jgi:SAM-dependent methyltransferase
MNTPRYQRDLSLHSPILLDTAYKRPKVAKMLAILDDAGVPEDGRRDLAVDIGCSGGQFTAALAAHFQSVVGVDIDPHALRIAQRDHGGARVGYVLGDSLRLPFPEAAADLVVCNHVYEHVPDAEQLFAEIHRVLRPGGACYLGAASRLAPIEPHYHLPFLSWLPKAAAHRYLRATGKGPYYYEKLRSYWGIRRLLTSFETRDYTLRVLADPDRFHARDLLPAGGLLARVPFRLWRLAYPLLPSYILVLRRPV